jgi:hypothetical protein
MRSILTTSAPSFTKARAKSSFGLLANFLFRKLLRAAERLDFYDLAEYDPSYPAKTPPKVHDLAEYKRAYLAKS